jgi:hypothetical protein
VLAKFSVWRQDAVAFEDLSAYYFSTMNLTEGNDPIADALETAGTKVRGSRPARAHGSF